MAKNNELITANDFDNKQNQYIDNIDNAKLVKVDLFQKFSQNKKTFNYLRYKIYHNIGNNNIEEENSCKQKIYLNNNKFSKYYKIFINYKQKYKNKLINEYVYSDLISIRYHKTQKFLVSIRIFKQLIINPSIFLNVMKKPTIALEKNSNIFNFNNFYHKIFRFEYFDFLDLMIIKFNNDIDSIIQNDDENVVNNNNENDCWNIVKNSTFYDKKFVDFDDQQVVQYKNINLQFYWNKTFLQEIRILNFKESCRFIN